MSTNFKKAEKPQDAEFEEIKEQLNDVPQGVKTESVIANGDNDVPNGKETLIERGAHWILDREAKKKEKAEAKAKAKADKKAAKDKAKSEKTGMATWKKVAIGVGAGAVVGAGALLGHAMRQETDECRTESPDQTPLLEGSSIVQDAEFEEISPTVDSNVPENSGGEDSV